MCQRDRISLSPVDWLIFEEKFLPPLTCLSLCVSVLTSLTLTWLYKTYSCSLISFSTLSFTLLLRASNGLCPWLFGRNNLLSLLFIVRGQLLWPSLPFSVWYSILFQGLNWFSCSIWLAIHFPNTPITSLFIPYCRFRRITCARCRSQA